MFLEYHDAAGGVSIDKRTYDINVDGGWLKKRIEKSKFSHFATEFDEGKRGTKRGQKKGEQVNL